MGKDASESQFQRVQYLDVSAEQADRRIDNFLISQLHLPKSRVYRMIRKGEVRVNKKRVKTDYRVQEGDLVRVPPIFQENSQAPIIPKHVETHLLNSILYEDDAFLVINKPSGIPVHAGSGLPFGVIEAFKTQPLFTGKFIELAHRLDRETSGCLLLTKQAKALREVQQLLKERQTEKRYLALLKGRWQGGPRLIDLALKRHQPNEGERYVTVSKEGKVAKSEFLPIIGNDVCTLVEVLLHTGRTHQIRVHAAAIGMPLAGDPKYGDEAFNKTMREYGLKRLFLHAHRLAVSPASFRNLDVTAPLDTTLQSVLNKLGLDYP